MTRNGKIARLPRALREELNRRMDDGETGATLLDWLNARDDVRAVLAENFDGRPINAQNLSEWRLGGFAEWLRQQETRAWCRSLADEAAGIEEETGNQPVAGVVATLLAIELARRMKDAASKADNDPDQLKALLAIARELARLRRGDRDQTMARIANERWETEKAIAAEAKREKDEEEQSSNDYYAAKEIVLNKRAKRMAAEGKTFDPANPLSLLGLPDDAMVAEIHDLMEQMEKKRAALAAGNISKSLMPNSMPASGSSGANSNPIKPKI